MLILVHPDCCIEVGADAAKRYTELLREHLPKFDYVISHMFLDGRPWSHSWDEGKIRAHDELYNLVKRLSNVAMHDPRNLYSCSYDKELPDFLIENQDTNVYMSGGYEGNCLWISYQRLFEKLGWLLKENGQKVSYYKPLLFHPGELGTGEYLPAKWHSDFHPSKVNYNSGL